MLYAVKITVGALTAAAGAAAPVVAPVTWDVGWILTAIGMICAGLAVVVRTIWSAATERQSVLESQKSVAQELMQLHTKFDQREYVAAR